MNKDIIKADAERVMAEVMEKARLKDKGLFIAGCSSSEVIGKRMGTSKDGQTDEAVEIIYEVINRYLSEINADLAVQCCEHLNRAVVCDRSVADKYGFDVVNVIPQIHAGGAFAVKHYKSLKDPVVVESIGQKADAGIDIGGVMIGMHIHPVVVPLRLENRHIGEAIILAARRRPKYVGGERAVYDPELA